MADEEDPSSINATQVETCNATVGEKRKIGGATIIEDAGTIKEATKIGRAAEPGSTLANIIAGSAQNAVPSGPTGLAEQDGPASPAEQDDPNRLATLEDLNTMLAPYLAKLDNMRTRDLNSRLRPGEQWRPLKRERPQQVLPGGQLSAAPGDLPPAGLIPLRGREGTAEALQALSAHYGEQFANWEEFEDFMY